MTPAVPPAAGSAASPATTGPAPHADAPCCYPVLPYGGRGHPDPVPAAPALDVTDLGFSYDRAAAAALRGVSLTVERGRRVALVGANGAGKSTLLKLVAGLLRPTTGSARVFGNRVGACHHRTAYLPQRSDLDWAFPLSVHDLVMTGRYMHLGWFKRPGRADRDIVNRTLDHLGLAALSRRQIGELSGGQQQRTLLARTLVQQADLLLLDEPWNAVDAETGRIIERVIEELAHAGRTVVAATHDAERLGRCFDRIVHLRNGGVAESEDGRGLAAAASTAVAGA